MEIPAISNGWLYHPRSRYNVSPRAQHGEAGSGRSEAPGQQIMLLRTLLPNYQPRNIYSCDETGLFWKLEPQQSLLAGSVHDGKKVKARITLHFACNVDGSDKVPVWIIGKNARPRAFVAAHTLGPSLNCHWRYNGNAWMNTKLFEEWLVWFNLHVTPRRVLLLMDHFSAHVSAVERVNSLLTHVVVCWLPPNGTSVHQPLDQGIIRTFKAHYRQRWLRYMLDEYEEGRDPQRTRNVLKAVRWSVSAWESIIPGHITHCWNHTSLLQLPPHLPISDAFQTVNRMISTLIQELRAQQRISEAMNIDNFIFPPAEAVVATQEGIEADILRDLYPGPDAEEDEELEVVPKVSVKDALLSLQKLQLFEEQQEDGSAAVIYQLNQMERLLRERKESSLPHSQRVYFTS